MKNHFTLFVLFSLTILIVGCVEDEPIPPIEPKTDYAFFVAGHTYGRHGINNIGLHPPFEAYYDTINAFPRMLFGVLTGDIVLSSTEQNWDEVDASIQRIMMPVHFAFGNHDIQWNRPLVEARYGQSYGAFTQENDLFILLDSNIDSLNISGDQLDFLTQTLDSLGNDAEHIFVFVHHMLWWEDDNLFANAPPNGVAQKAENVNFWSTIEPMFNALDKPVIFFSGDAGANHVARSLTYYNDGDITYITSGMGYGQADNFIIVEVMDDESLRLNLKGLNCPDGSDCMGNIEDYTPD